MADVPNGTVYEDGSIEGMETQPIDLLERVEETPVDRCVELAQDTYYCVTPDTSDPIVDSMAPTLGYWAQYMLNGWQSNGWSEYFLEEPFKGIFEYAAWIINLWMQAGGL